MKVLHRLALIRWITILWISMALTSVAHAQASRISVMINSVSNKGCFDQFIFCQKPDMVVSVALRQLDGVRVRCPDTTPVVDRDNIATLASCSNSLVDGPVDVVIAISDVDQSHLTDTPIPINKQFNMAPAGSNRNETEAAFRPFQTVAPLLYRAVDADILFTVTTTPVPPVFKNPALSLSRPSFDPNLGERVLFSNRLVLADDTSTDYPSTTPMNVVVTPPGGAPFNLVTGATINKFFNLDWDGKINGQRAPNGTYTIQARLNSGGVSTAQVQVTSVPSVFEVSPPTATVPWNPRAGPLSFPYRLSPQAAVTTRVEGPAAAGSACTAGALPIAVPLHAMNLNAGSGVLDVELKGMNGIFLPSGNYCARFQATAIGGAALGTVSQEINVNNAPELRLIARVSPAIPALVPSVTAPIPNPISGGPVLVPSTPITVDVLALDINRQARPTGQITVKAYPLLVIPINPAFISQITCNAASSCRLTISMATLAAGGGTATGTGNIAIEAFANDLPNQGGVAPAPASARVAPRGLDITRTSGSRPIMVSVPLTGDPSKGFDIVPRNQTMDVAFHAGTGLDLTIPAQATFFSDFVGNAHQLFFGGDAAVGDTMTMTPAGAAATAFWLSKTPAIVGIRGSGTQGNLCDRQFVDYVSFAETQAVIHNVNCRDNADGGGGTFSALIGSGSVASTRILWHEFHHAVYDLADEYPPDGGYFQTADLPNVMNGPTECTLRGAEPTLCMQIGTTGWWRAAPANDVMIGNTQENLDDRRRATFIINKCKAAQC